MESGKPGPEKGPGFFSFRAFSPYRRADRERPPEGAGSGSGTPASPPRRQEDPRRRKQKDRRDEPVAVRLVEGGGRLFPVSDVETVEPGPVQS